MIRKNIKKIVISMLLIVGLFSVINIKAANSFKITNVKVVDKEDTVDVNDLTYEELTLNSDVVFHKVGDYIIYEITLKNETGYDYTLKTLALTSNNAYIEYTCEDCNDLEIKNKEEKKVHLKATYKTQVANMGERLRDENFEVQLTLIDNNKDETIENPKTGLGLRVYTILGLIVALGIIALIGLKKTKSKIVSLIVLVLLIPIIVEAQDGALRLNINIKYNLLDRVVVSKDNNGTVTEQIVEYGETIEVPANPERTGYTFNGWYINGEKKNAGEEIELTGDIEFEARYTPITYTIEYNLNGGSITGSNPESYTIETGTENFINPTKAGYDFVGWQGAVEEGTCNPCKIQIGVYGNKTYTAVYTPRGDTEYKVIHRYEKLDGTYEEVEETKTGETDATIEAVAFSEREGFNNPASQSITITADGQASVTYTYLRKTYTLTLTDSEYIEANKTSGTYKYGTVITLTAINKTGYTFDKWSNEETENPYTFNITENTTIGPVYTPNTNTPYVIKRYIQNINDNGYTEDVSNRYEGQGTTNDSISAYDISDYEGKYEKNTSHPNYQASGTILPDGSTVLTVYYDRVVYDVTFETDGGTEIAQQHIRYGGKVTEPSDLTKEHYGFAGWYKDSEYSELFDFDTDIIEGTTTIYAKFNAILADKIIYNAQSENLTSGQISAGYAVYTAPTNLPTQPAQEVSGATESILSTAEDDYGTSYYFRGNVKNNYVNFAGMCWRIVRIEGDGSIKLILDDSTHECNDGYTGDFSITTASGKYGEITSTDNPIEFSNVGTRFANFEDGKMINAINSWLNNSSIDKSKLKEETWCVGSRRELYFHSVASSRTDYNHDNGDPYQYGEMVMTDWMLHNHAFGAGKAREYKVMYYKYWNLSYIPTLPWNNSYAQPTGKPSFKCSESAVYDSYFDSHVTNDSPITTNSYVGVLSVDELTYAGGKVETRSSLANEVDTYPNNYYLKSTVDYWTSSISGYDGKEKWEKAFYVDSTGNISDTGILDESKAYRPSIVLNSGTKISGGNGLQNAPYIIE